MAATVVFVNQKGGVGKTTVTLAMASAARAAGHRVLVVDLDSQASCTWALGIDPATYNGPTVVDVLDANKSGAAEKAITASRWGESVDLIPATGALIEREAGAGNDQLLRLRKGLEGMTDPYDVVLVDSAPSLGSLTLTALAAAHYAVMVVEPAALSLRGVAAVADAIDGVWASLNPTLDLAGVIVNKMPAISLDADHRYDDLVKMVGKKALWQPAIPQRVVVPQATSERTPIHDFGYRAAEVIGAVDMLYARLRRTIRRGPR